MLRRDGQIPGMIWSLVEWIVLDQRDSLEFVAGRNPVCVAVYAFHRETS